MSSAYRTRGGQPFSRYALTLWLRSPRGQRLLALEQRELRRVLPEVFGRSILQIGSWGQGDSLLEAADMPHRVVVGTASANGASALAEPENLPIVSRSVDAVLLPHTLEFARSAHNVLREADRVLSDRGRLLILGFNPWSIWCLRERLGLFRYRAFPEGAHFVAMHRVCDWLELLGYEITLVRRYGVGFPWSQPTSVTFTLSLRSVLRPLMEAYMVVAKKRVIPLTVSRLPRRAQVRPLLAPVGLPGARAQAE